MAERHTEKAAYNANAKVPEFRFYWRRDFDESLKYLNGDDALAPQEATERQFTEALRRTSKAVVNKSLLRFAMRAGNEYQGPQCVCHRDVPARLNFDPQRDVRTTHRGFRSKDLCPMLQCSESTYAKWRRVDASTKEVF